MRLEGCTSLAEALARVARRPRAQPPGRTGCAATAGGAATGAAGRADARRPRRGDRRRAGRAHGAKDYHSLWLNSAGARARRRRPRRRAAAWSSVDAQGEPTGRPARGVGVALPRAAHRRSPRTSTSTPMRAGIRIAHARGVTAVHDKDGWLGALRALAAARAEEARSRCASGSRFRTTALDELRRARARAPGSATTCCGSAT